MTAGDVLLECLLEWDVDTVFGLPGDGVNGIIEAFRTRQSKIRFIQVRHEEAAALMACGYAKYTGNLGVCVASSGPGGIHLLNGLTMPSSMAPQYSPSPAYSITILSVPTPSRTWHWTSCSRTSASTTSA